MLAGFDLLFRLQRRGGTNGDQFDARSRQSFATIEGALQCPFLGGFIVPEQVGFSFRALNLEIRGRWLVPLIQYSGDVVTLIIEHELTGPFIGFVAGIRLDIHGERHAEIFPEGRGDSYDFLCETQLKSDSDLHFTPFVESKTAWALVRRVTGIFVNVDR